MAAVFVFGLLKMHRTNRVLLLVILLVAYCAKESVGTAVCDLMQTELQHLIKNYSYVMDLNVNTDRNQHEKVLAQFPLLLERVRSAGTGCRHPSDLLHSVIRAIYRSHNYISKDMLASHKLADVGWFDLEKFASEWVYQLLDMLLDNKYGLDSTGQLPDLNGGDALGLMPLHLAVLFREHRILNTILQQDQSKQKQSLILDAGAPGYFSMTPLHFAVINADLHATQVLLAQGASFDVPDVFGRSVCHLLMHHVLPHTEIKDVLVQVLSGSQECPNSYNPLTKKDVCRTRLNVSQPTSSTLKYEGCPFERVDASDLDEHRFTRDFKSLQLPLIIVNGMNNWQVMNSWQLQSLSENFGSIGMLVGPIPYAKAFGEPSKYLSLTTYITYMQRLNRTTPTFDEQPPAYLFDHEVMDRDQQFFNPNLNPLPEFFNAFRGTPMIKQFILGPRRSGAPFHYHCDAVNGLVWGKKRWLLVPPAHAVYSKEHPTRYSHRFSVTGELKSDPKSHSNNSLRPAYFCEQQAGEMIYVPSFWTHATLNFESALCFALEFDKGDC